MREDILAFTEHVLALFPGLCLNVNLILKAFAVLLWSAVLVCYPEPV